MTASPSSTPPADGLWGIGSYAVGGELVTFPVADADLARDMATANKNLATLGVGRGSRALVTSMLAEAAQYWPVQIGLLMAGTQMSCADASRFDAFRTRMFLRGPAYDAAIGISGAVLDGLADLGQPLGELFSVVPVVAARAEAVERLRAEGVAARLWLHVGPTIAVECAPGAGAHVDDDEWAVEADDGEILITARNPRAATVDRARTGVRADVITDPCACGRGDARLLPRA